MNLIAFPVGTTNIFPIANSVTGGQLLTEFNMRSRESVETNSEIKYMVGPSFTHSMEDFYVSKQTDNMGVTISNSTLMIQPGRAVVNGHFLESLAPVVIDVLEANQRLIKAGKPSLSGELAIGLRMMYSTKKTIAGSLRAENDDDYFEGVHVVILPKEEFILPEDSPGDESKVTGHLLLATFTYSDGQILDSSIQQNEGKTRSISAERIKDVEKIVDANYLSGSNLDPHKLYSLAGAQDTEHEDEVPRPTWQDSTGSLMIWDADHTTPEDVPSNGVIPTVGYAKFEVNTDDDRVDLVIPHLINAKSHLYNSAHRRVYYPDAVLKFPKADFSHNTPGTVTSEYTKRIKLIDEKLNNFYHVTGGRLIMYIDYLREDPYLELPKLPIYVNKLPYQKSTKESYELLISLLQGRVIKLEDELELMRTDFEAKLSSSKKITQLADKDEQLAASIKLLTSRVDALELNINASSESSEDEESIYTKPDAATEDEAVKQLQVCIEELQTAAKQVSTSFNNYKATVDSFKDQFSDVQGYIVDIQNRLENIDIAYSNLQTTVTDLVDQAIAKDIEEYKAQILEEVGDIDRKVNDRFDKLLKQYHIDRDGIVPGDYVIVGEDLSQISADSEGRAPSTMYVVVPGRVTNAKYVGKIDKQYIPTSGYKKALEDAKRLVPDSLNYGGAMLNAIELSSDYNPGNVGDDISSDMASQLAITEYRGQAGIDYFVVRVVKTDENNLDDDGNPKITELTQYFYTPEGDATATLEWSNPPIRITGGVPYATVEQVGGFRNVEPTQLGQGYVIRNDDGTLQLLDYNLLAQGIYAYQLGQDYETSRGLDAESLQSEIDNYVNSRVAFPNINQLQSYSTHLQQFTINVTVDISAWSSTDGSNVITIGNIDSRFGTAVHIHVVGEASNNTVLELINIQRLKLDVSSINGNLTINLRNCELCYDSYILNKLNLIENLKLWYQKYEEEDPDLIVDGMTVELVNHSGVATTEDYWSEKAGGDYLFNYALKSITFGSDGSILRMGMFISDDSTPNITPTYTEGTRIFGASFKAPQSLGLPYPEKRANKQIKISGSFITAYYASELGGYVVKDNTFTALTQKYDALYGKEITGTISIYSRFSVVKNAIINFNGNDGVGESIDGWAPGKFHVFYGGTID